jgi:hypothetical protein
LPSVDQQLAHHELRCLLALLASALALQLDHLVDQLHQAKRPDPRRVASREAASVEAAGVMIVGHRVGAAL